MMSPKPDSDSECDSDVEEDTPCPVCDTMSRVRRCVRIPRGNETFADKECGYCGAILRYFTIYVTFEELEDRYIGNRFVKVTEVEETDESDKIKVVFRRNTIPVRTKLEF